VKREYPDAPLVAVGVVIQRDHELLVVCRDKEPGRGLWTFPGGALELGESLLGAARREALEETGLEVEVGEPVAVVDSIVPDPEGAILYHYVIVDYLARQVGGSLCPASDVSAARWVTLADLDSLAMTAKAAELARRVLEAAVSKTAPGQIWEL